MSEQFTARQMIAALYRHHYPRWAPLTEVTARPAAGGEKYRRIDMLLVRSGKVAFDLLAIEVKVTRADFLSDLRNPAKQAPWRELAQRHAYAVPKGLVGECEVPAGSGLLVVSRDRGYTTVRTAVRAVKPAGHNPPALPMANIMDAFYRAARAEATIKGIDGARTDDSDPEALRAELAKLRGDVERMTGQLERAKEAQQLWKLAFAAVGYPPCATCGKPLKVSRRRAYGMPTWEHTTAIDAAGCDILRLAAAIAANDAAEEYLRLDQRYVRARDPEPAELPEPSLAE